MTLGLAFLLSCLSNVNGGIGIRIVNEMKAAQADEDWVVKMLLRIIFPHSCFQVVTEQSARRSLLHKAKPLKIS